jgi:hypothetical protein
LKLWVVTVKAGFAIRPTLRIIRSLNVGHAPITIDLQISHVALRTAAAVEEKAALTGILSLLINARLEIVEQIKFHEINQTGEYFIRHSVVFGISEFVICRRRSFVAIGILAFTSNVARFIRVCNFECRLIGLPESALSAASQRPH